MTTLYGKRVMFYCLDARPAGARKIATVKENGHTFFRARDGLLIMENCVGDFFEILNYKRKGPQTFATISQDYEELPDEWAAWGEHFAKRPGDATDIRLG